MNYFLGIDTSCYTTSLAAIDEKGFLLSEVRRLLKVKAGQRGLQQSEMVFQHTRNLPELVTELFQQLAAYGHHLSALGVSTAPRANADSYMPAFLAGVSLARSLAAACSLPLYQLSHQENHLEAGLWSAALPEALTSFLMIHASGGTTDLLLCELGSDKRYRLQNIGGSKDLHAGQFIDRVGVALGLQFPCGPNLEKLAATAEIAEKLPVAVQELQISFSGPASAAARRLDEGVAASALALGVQSVLAESFSRVLQKAADLYNITDVLLVGGVACNQFIRQYLEERLTEKNIKLWLPHARYSSDNACGCAALARRLFTAGIAK